MNRINPSKSTVAPLAAAINALRFTGPSVYLGDAAAIRLPFRVYRMAVAS